MTSLDPKPQHYGQMVTPGERDSRLRVAAMREYGAPSSQHCWQDLQLCTAGNEAPSDCQALQDWESLCLAGCLLKGERHWTEEHQC